MLDKTERADLDRQIAIVRANISELMEQATGVSGAAAEERLVDRLSEQQEQLDVLLKKREALG